MPSVTMQTDYKFCFWIDETSNGARFVISESDNEEFKLSFDFELVGDDDGYIDVRESIKFDTCKATFFGAEATVDNLNQLVNIALIKGADDAEKVLNDWWESNKDELEADSKIDNAYWGAQA